MSARHLAGVAISAVAPLVAASAAQPPKPSAFERPIDVAHPGLVAVGLDRDVYERARRDLGDLRVLDEAGAPVPYVLERGVGPASARRQPVIRNRGFRRGQSAAATLDFGAPVFKRELTLSLSGDNFRRRVVVEGSADGWSWATLTDGAYVFAVPGPTRARYETVPLPDNDHPFLRVTVHRGPDDPEQIEILDAWVRTEARRRPREEPLTASLLRAEDAKARETLVVVDLRARHQPFQAVALDVEDKRFFRGVVVEARRDPPLPKPGESSLPVAWIGLAEGAVYRYEEGGNVYECLRLAALGRERAIRLRIRNRDDRPLAIRGVTVLAPVERVVFDAAPACRYKLRYGSPDLPAPEYDLPRTIGDPETWIARATEARLGPVARLPEAPAPLPPWTERHPALLRAGLVAVVALLGTVTWRALRAAR